MNVAVVGASPNPDRYSYKAMKMLESHGHKVFLVSPVYPEVEGRAVYKQLSDISEPIHTVTMYVNAEKSSKLQQQLIDLAPKRVIFNPGAENPGLVSALSSKDIECLEACTLVMLTIGNF